MKIQPNANETRRRAFLPPGRSAGQLPVHHTGPGAHSDSHGERPDSCLAANKNISISTLVEAERPLGLPVEFDLDNFIPPEDLEWAEWRWDHPIDPHPGLPAGTAPRPLTPVTFAGLHSAADQSVTSADLEWAAWRWDCPVDLQSATPIVRSSFHEPVADGVTRALRAA